VIASGIKHCILSPGIMSLRITEFPKDILLELAKRLDVADLLSLLSVSQQLCGHQSRYLTTITCFLSSAASSANSSSRGPFGLMLWSA
jgi:hypothetical protein